MVWSCGDGHSHTMDTGIRERHGDAHNHQPITGTEENSAHSTTEQTQSSAYSHAQEPDGETEINCVVYVVKCLQVSTVRALIILRPNMLLTS